VRGNTNYILEIRHPY